MDVGNRSLRSEVFSVAVTRVLKFENGMCFLYGAGLVTMADAHYFLFLLPSLTARPESDGHASSRATWRG